MAPAFVLDFRVVRAGVVASGTLGNKMLDYPSHQPGQQYQRNASRGGRDQRLAHVLQLAQRLGETQSQGILSMCRSGLHHHPTNEEIE